jgi:hypothetical protein
LHIIDVVHAEPVQFELDDFENLSVEALDQRDYLQIAVAHVICHDETMRGIPAKPRPKIVT